MEKLIEALQILLKYGNPDYPTHCIHDILIIVGIDPDKVSEEDTLKLKQLGFFPTRDYGEHWFVSFRYGSA
jgi:hypothetical protein